LKKPEELEPGNVQRTTASVTYNQTRSDGFWASSLIWGWNRKILFNTDVHSFLFETLLQFQHKNYLTGRIEFVDKDELFIDHHEGNNFAGPHAGEVFNIKSFTAGYARDFEIIPRFQTGIGANVTFYSTPSELNPFYGENPKGFFFYLRIRGGQHAH
jgi:hypothetical protein